MSQKSSRKLLVVAYVSGAHPDEGIALVQQVVALQGAIPGLECYIAADAPRYDLKYWCEQEGKGLQRAFIIESKKTIGKARMIAGLLANSHHDNVVFFDHTTVLSDGWIDEIKDAFNEIERSAACNTVQPYASAKISKAYLLRHELSSQEVGAMLIEGLTRMGVLEVEEAREITPPQQLSACQCTYGDNPHLILRAVDSILSEPFYTHELEYIIGCNQVSSRVMTALEQRFLDQKISVLIRSPQNINKSGMQRVMFRLARSPYILSIDDDIYFLPHWFALLKEFVSKNHPFETGGNLHMLSTRMAWSGKKKPYHEFCTKKKWWNNKVPYGDEVLFPAGQCYVARRQFLLENDYPDLNMKIDWDDVLLGDMAIQLGGKQVWFDDELKKLIVIDTSITSRGAHGGG